MTRTAMFSQLRRWLPGIARVSPSPQASSAHRTTRYPPLTRREVKSLYRRPPTFTDLLPWVEYDPSTQAFLLDDGISVGALFELQPVSCEARPEPFLTTLRDQLQGVIGEAIPEEDDAPWILQLYVQDEPVLADLDRQLGRYARERAGDPPFTRHYLRLLHRHLEQLTRPGGLFIDEAVTGTRWRGQRRRVRAVLYRRLSPGSGSPDRHGLSPTEALNEVCYHWTAALEEVGVLARRGGGRELYDWLVPWFNPALAEGDPAKLLALAPYPGDENLPFGRDLAESFTFSMPRTDRQTQTWWFDDLPHGIVSIQALRSGAGKSALLVYLLMQLMAVYRPRLVIIESGNSFGLLGQYFAEHGLSVNAVALSPTADVSLPPFADALKLLSEPGRPPRAIPAEEILQAEFEPDDLPEEEEDRHRDLLGEMEIAARIMITGGDEREDARLTRPDRLVIRKAILQAAETVQASGREQVITEDVVAAFAALAQDSRLPENRRLRAQEMGDGMALFCSGLAGHFFNRPGQAWPEADVTILEMGLLAREGYQDQLTVAFLGMLNRINDRVERGQYDGRQTLVVADEGHLITTNPLLAPYVVKITKMWRKLGAWFWIATQNLEDFPDASKRMLNMMEWWLCLVMPKEEVDQIARFRKLTDEQRALLLSTRKEPSKYVEGVVLSDTLQALFRSVVPPLCLALAMTEPEEKAERARLMREHRCSELEAARLIAQRIEAGRAT